MKQNYAQLPEEEKEKDRVVARALLQAIKGEQGVAEGFLNESAYEEAWELISQPVPEIQQFVKQLGLAQDDPTAKQIAPMIDATPDTQLPAASIPKLKNLANKGNDVQTLKAIQQISGRPDAAQQYAKIMQARDAGEGRQRGYDVSGLINSVKSGNYEAPVLLKLATGTYVIGGRTRLYAALALGIPAKVKIISVSTFAKQSQQGVAEGNSGAKYKVKSIGRDSKGDYYISPNTGKKVYKQAQVGDHEVPGTGEIKKKVAEGSLELNTPDPVVVIQDLKGNMLDKLNLSVASQKYKLGNPQNIKNQLAHQNYTTVGSYVIVSPMGGQPQDATTRGVAESWSKKYKSSINCSHPKGFSQKAHCAGKKKHNEDMSMEAVCPDCGMCETHGNLNEIKKGAKDSNGYSSCWKGYHAAGTKKGKNGGQVRNCVPNEGVAEGSGNRCKQCGMIDCPCPGVTCKCKPIAGWVPGKGFKKAMDEAALSEKLNLKAMDTGAVIKDFEKSNAPQFRGKTKEKRKQMAIAAKNSAMKKKKKIGESLEEEDYYYVVRHQSKRDIETEMPSKAWDAVGPKYATYEEAKAVFDQLKAKHPQEKFTYTRHPRISNMGGTPKQVFPEGWTTDSLASHLFEQELTYEDRLNNMLSKKLSK
jgi:hypothetical protein